MKKFCGKCGNPIESGTKFCVKCGAKIVEETEQSQEQPVTNAPESTTKKGLKPWQIALIAGGGVVLALIIVIVIAASSCGKSTKTSSATTSKKTTAATTTAASTTKATTKKTTAETTTAKAEKYFLGATLVSSVRSSDTYVDKFAMVDDKLVVKGRFKKASSKQGLGNAQIGSESEHTFKLTSQTKYYGAGGDSDTPTVYTKEQIDEICSKLEGLFLILELEGDTIISITVSS